MTSYDISGIFFPGFQHVSMTRQRAVTILYSTSGT